MTVELSINFQMETDTEKRTEDFIRIAKTLEGTALAEKDQIFVLGKGIVLRG